MFEIKSKGNMTVLVTKHTEMHTTATIKFKGKIYKLSTNHYNGSCGSSILMFTEENGFVCIFNHYEINDLVDLSYVSSDEEKLLRSQKNFWAMVKHLETVFN